MSSDKKHVIVLIEDDQDDKDFFEAILKDLNVSKELIWHERTDTAFEYLSTTEDTIFLIFCDINVPPKSGLEFKKSIDDDAQLRRKSIPFVFYSTSSNQRSINEAFIEMTIQGYFKKVNNYHDMKLLIKTVIDYWELCLHPNTQ